jgi:hypothetical protein
MSGNPQTDNNTNPWWHVVKRNLPDRTVKEEYFDPIQMIKHKHPSVPELKELTYNRDKRVKIEKQLSIAPQTTRSPFTPSFTAWQNSATAKAAPPAAPAFDAWMQTAKAAPVKQKGGKRKTKKQRKHRKAGKSKKQTKTKTKTKTKRKGKSNTKKLKIRKHRKAGNSKKY